MNEASKYSMVIRWSQEDRAYVVTLPEFENARTHGDTYEEAARNGAEVLSLIIDTYREDGRPLPNPATLVVA